MSSGLKLLCFIMILPVIAAMGHDGYLIYLDIEAETPEPLKLSALGWIWEAYHPASHEWMKDFVGAESWEAFIKPVLELKALYATAGLALIICGPLAILNKLGLWPFNDNPGLFREGAKKPSDDFSFDAEIANKKKKVKYNRK